MGRREGVEVGECEQGKGAFWEMKVLYGAPLGIKGIIKRCNFC